ncbi:hypothetical protein D3C87_1602830 [compost metagenome]
MIVIEGGEACGLMSLLAEALDQKDVGEALVEVGEHVADPPLGGRGPVAQPVGEHADRPAHQRHPEHCEGRQVPVEDEQVADGAHDDNQAGHKLGRGDDQGVLQQVHVADQARREVPGGPGLEVSETLRLQPRKKGRA